MIRHVYEASTLGSRPSSRGIGKLGVAGECGGAERRENSGSMKLAAGTGVMPPKRAFMQNLLL